MLQESQTGARRRKYIKKMFHDIKRQENQLLCLRNGMRYFSHYGLPAYCTFARSRRDSKRNVLDNEVADIHFKVRLSLICGFSIRLFNAALLKPFFMCSLSEKNCENRNRLNACSTFFSTRPSNLIKMSFSFSSHPAWKRNLISLVWFRN